MKKVLLLIFLFFSVIDVWAENGILARELRNKVNIAKTKLQSNSEAFNKDKKVQYLDENYSLIAQTRDDIYSFYKRALRKSTDTLYESKTESIKAKIDETEIKLLGQEELPSFCEQLYNLGQSYIEIGETKKAKQSYREILINYTTNEFKTCNKKAEFALDDLKEQK